MGQGARIRRLTNIETLGVALVKRGANKKQYAITKSEGETDMTVTELLAQIIQKGEMPMADEELDKMCASAGLDKQGTELYKAMCKLAMTHKDNPGMKKMVTDNFVKMFGGAAEAADEEETEEVEEETEEKETKFDTKKSDDTQGDTMAENDTQMKDAVAKAEQKNQELEALLKSQQDTIAKMNESIAKERDERVKGEWVAKADRDLKFVPETSAELGEKLFKMEKALGTEEAAKYFETLKGMSETLSKSTLFTGNGPAPRGDKAGSADAWSQIVAKAESLIEKGDIDAKGNAAEVRARAIARTIELFPGLYRDYVNEQSAQRGQGKYNH